MAERAGQRPARGNCFISFSAASSRHSTRSSSRDLKSLDIVGIYPNYAEAFAAWRDAAQRSVDDAHMRYFIVHLHRLLDPETESGDA